MVVSRPALRELRYDYSEIGGRVMLGAITERKPYNAYEGLVIHYELRLAYMDVGT